FQLPHSGLSFTLSHMAWVRPDSNASAEISLIPDIIVNTTADDIKNDIDPQVEALKKEIKRLQVN
ncbi:MAG: hypothetical protein K6T85_02290, partial [Gorillibacterium sp.]|nr:hypothetical protein [Gorillibacterium sp.]